MKVLVVDDDPGSLLVARAAVEALGHECLTANDGESAWRLFQEHTPDVLVTDRAMPGLDGVELCRAVREAEADGYTYVVLVTGLSDPSDVLSGMLAGADDYLAKPLDPFTLETRLLAAQRVTALHAELGRYRRQLLELARTDALTGLRNRHGLRDELRLLHATSERYGRGYGVALCDIDHFKSYNDTYGHAAGDEALRTVATALAGQLRDVDRVYRYGGEEFLVLLPEQSEHGAVAALERVRRAVEALGVPHAGPGAPGVVTISSGVATYVPARPATTQQLLAAADKALYAAKSAGRNGVTAATAPPGVPPAAADGG